MEKSKIDELDRRTYYPMSFNEQMAWIDEQVAKADCECPLYRKLEKSKLQVQ